MQCINCFKICILNSGTQYNIMTFLTIQNAEFLPGSIVVVVAIAVINNNVILCEKSDTDIIIYIRTIESIIIIIYSNIEFFLEALI